MFKGSGTVCAAPVDGSDGVRLCGSHPRSRNRFGLGQHQAACLKRFPQTTPESLEEAHAYAYGGCIIQDMGYYPFGSHYFSDLTHYVRSGDFVQALLHEAQDVNELAFALGALAHYAADNNGHPLAVNRAVPIEYPKLRAKFGNEVTYEDDKHRT